MQIQSTQLDNAVMVKLSGRMDAENAGRFQKECEDWITRGSNQIVVELSDLEYVSSMGLGCFLSVAKSVQPKAGKVVLCRLHGLPKQVFEMTKLIGLFQVFDTMDAALASLS